MVPRQGQARWSTSGGGCKRASSLGVKYRTLPSSSRIVFAPPGQPCTPLTTNSLQQCDSVGPTRMEQVNYSQCSKKEELSSHQSVFSKNGLRICPYERAARSSRTLYCRQPSIVESSYCGWRGTPRVPRAAHRRAPYVPKARNMHVQRMSEPAESWAAAVRSRGRARGSSLCGLRAASRRR